MSRTTGSSGAEVSWSAGRAPGQEVGDGRTDGPAADPQFAGQGGDGAPAQVGGAYVVGLVGPDGHAPSALVAGFDDPRIDALLAKLTVEDRRVTMAWVHPLHGHLIRCGPLRRSH
ncbi:hypothetical protein [Streptomyces rubrogriseus]|uniref:hypothetical protein n=1 Tax=Streptomyces rubrogriseus TaxID=194673 RepID=UPI00382C7540